MHYCKGLAPVKHRIYQLASVLGTPRSELLSPKAWIFGLNSADKLLHPFVRALLRLYWRIVYRHLTQQEREGIKFYSPRVSQEILRTYMARVLAHQHSLYLFSTSRRYTCLPKVLPAAAVTLNSPLGTLDVDTGRLDLSDDFKAFMIKHDVFTDFDLEIDKL